MISSGARARTGRLRRLLVLVGLALFALRPSMNFLNLVKARIVGSSGLAGTGNHNLIVPLRPHTATSSGPRVQANADPGTAAFTFTDWATALQFLAALSPAILVEIIVLPPVQRLLTSMGVREDPDSRDYVTGSDNTIKVQRGFDFQAWEKQRQNPDRYWQILSATLGNSTMLSRLQGPLLALNIVAAAVLIYNVNLVPTGFPSLTLPALPFTLSSFVLGLLVTFRTNTSSNRYTLARNNWGDMLNVSRDLIQQAFLWTKDEEKARDFARWVPAFSLATMCHLRDPRAHDLKAEMIAAAGPPETADGKGIGLTEAEINEICARPAGMNAPHYVLHRMRGKLEGLGFDLSDSRRMLMEYNITRLINDLGSCENIFATPIPLGYTKHTARFLLLWLLLLPLALEGSLGFGVVFAQQLLAFGLLGVEDLGIQIEEPFAVLPLKKICTKISLEAQVVRANAALLGTAASVGKALPAPRDETPASGGNSEMAKRLAQSISAGSSSWIPH